MKKFSFIFAVIAGVVLCSHAVPAGDLERLVAANNAFAFDLLDKVAEAQPDANVFLSPFSVSSALQMVNNGAAGETRTEMLRTLKTSEIPADSLNAAFKDLNHELSGRSDVTLNLADGIWYQKGFHVKPAFFQDNQRYFQVELAGVDFENPQSAKEINDWADRQTKGKIKGVVSFPFPPLMRLILANAIYFKGTWTTPFNKRQTRSREFHLINGQSKKMPMMTRQDVFAYSETADYQAVELPYKGNLQMELYLPKTNSSPLKLAKVLASDALERHGFGQQKGSVTLPKFKIEYEAELNRPLMALGVTRAFKAGAADFSGIADEPLFISEVKQKSYVDVNEEGTEATAVTVVGVTALASMRQPPNEFTMIVDHPFFFTISDINTGSILFVGLVNDPATGD